MRYVGIKRKHELFDLLQKHRYLRTKMIAQTIYPSLHQCQVSLKKLYDKGFIERFRFDSREDYIYHLDKKVSQKWRHWDTLNHFHYWYMAEGANIVMYEFEVPYGPGQADGFYVVGAGGKNTKFFLEIDTPTSGPFEKVALYNAAYALYWRGQFWADPLGTGYKSFPQIVIITPRVDTVKRTLDQNIHGLEIKVFDVDSIQ